LRSIVHYSLHLVVPFGIARLLERTRWLRAALVLLGTMAVDADHLLSSPVYDPSRCSIGHHPLHTETAAVVYALLVLAPAPWRWVGIGLLMHLGTDLIDCLWMQT